jgi:hypothetical protein
LIWLPGIIDLVAWGSLQVSARSHFPHWWFRRGHIFHIGGFGAVSFSTLVVSARSHFPQWWFRRGLIFDIGGFGAWRHARLHWRETETETALS